MALEYDQKAGLLEAKVSQAAWKTKPSWFVVATEDGAIDPKLLRSTAERIGARTTEVKGSHVVYLTQPRAVAAVIESAAQGASRIGGAQADVSRAGPR